MSLMFEGPIEGWSLACGSCPNEAWSGRWEAADELMYSAEAEGWSFEQYRQWDGVTFADAECPMCNETEEEDDL